MKKVLSKLIYNIICNLLVAFALCFASALISSSPIDWVNFAINLLVAFTLSMAIGLFVPLTNIGKWFTGLFHIKNDTYAGNIKYRLLSTLIISFIYFIVVNPTLTILNFFMLGDKTFQECLISWLINIPFMLLVGFTSSFVFDFPAYRIAKKIDYNF